MSEHEHFEELCALSASGTISPSELSELQTHLATCAECREQLSAFAQVSAQALAVHGERYSRPLVPAGMTERFIERALREGIPVRNRTKASDAWADYFFGKTAAFAVAALVLVISAGFLLRQMSVKQPAISTVAAYVHSSSTPPIGGSPQSFEVSSEMVARLRSELDALAQDNRSLAKEKDGFQEETDRLEKENGELKRQLADSQLQAGNLQSQIASLGSDSAVVRQHSADQDSKITELTAELSKKNAALTDEIATLAERQNQVEDLKAQLGERDMEVKGQQKLLAAGSQVRDLITARNLHIIDVHDANGSGQHQRTFGRIFYTEGKSLVFYAYDLQESGTLDGKVAFHVWGSRLGDQQQALNLGVFRTENSNDGRWVLTCDDPKVLAKINTVFVTAESMRKNLDQPKGKRILYAFLGEQPNHP